MKNARILIVAAVGVIAVLVGVIVVLLGRLNASEPVTPPAPVQEEVGPRGVLVTEENAEEVMEEFEQPPTMPPGYFRVNQNLEWRFPDGASESVNAYIGNNESNTNNIYFDLIREDTEEVVYRSPVIPLGSTLEHFKLDVDLDAGSYPCVVQYHLVDEAQNTLSTLNFGVTVIVEG